MSNEMCTEKEKEKILLLDNTEVNLGVKTVQNVLKILVVSNISF